MCVIFRLSEDIRGLERFYQRESEKRLDYLNLAYLHCFKICQPLSCLLCHLFTLNDFLLTNARSWRWTKTLYCTATATCIPTSKGITTTARHPTPEAITTTANWISTKHITACACWCNGHAISCIDSCSINCCSGPIRTGTSFCTTSSCTSFCASMVDGGVFELLPHPTKFILNKNISIIGKKTVFILILSVLCILCSFFFINSIPNLYLVYSTWGTLQYWKCYCQGEYQSSHLTCKVFSCFI